jgi:hypothetical protein
MWLCFNDGFLSVVSDQHYPSRLVVRARRKQVLLNVCGKDVEVVENAGSDYRWRTFIGRKTFAALVASRIRSIGYTNFKGSVMDGDLHELYMKFGDLHRQYQENEETARLSHKRHGYVPETGKSK